MLSNDPQVRAVLEAIEGGRAAQRALLIALAELRRANDPRLSGEARTEHAERAEIWQDRAFRIFKGPQPNEIN
jgi:hypothetical protein